MPRKASSVLAIGAVLFVAIAVLTGIAFVSYLHHGPDSIGLTVKRKAMPRLTAFCEMQSSEEQARGLAHPDVLDVSFAQAVANYAPAEIAPDAQRVADAVRARYHGHAVTAAADRAAARRVDAYRKDACRTGHA